MVIPLDPLPRLPDPNTAHRLSVNQHAISPLRALRALRDILDCDRIVTAPDTVQIWHGADGDSA
jgi:hypothetical protein